MSIPLPDKAIEADGESRLFRFGLPALILAVGAAVRFYAIAHSSYWSDEGNTWALIQRSWSEIAAAAAADIHPPGSYWLLKLWASLFGVSEVTLRSFSALSGVLLVLVILLIGRRMMERAPATQGARWMPLGAAWVAALLPFQVYYSQEARMYMLLALLAGLLFLCVLALLPTLPTPGKRLLWLSAYALVASVGLWTHYSFPIVLAAAGLAWLLDWLRAPMRSGRSLAFFAAANGLALLLFAPWLDTAWRQVTTWPQGGDAVGLLDGGRLILHTLLFGLVRTTPEPSWPWLVGAALLPVAGVLALRANRTLPAILLWLGAPILLMVALGLISDAFLKFLLVASAPWCLLVAAAAEAPPAHLRPFARVGVAAAIALLAWMTLPAYYADPQARDNYKGVAAWLAASGNPEQEIVILNAPGQTDAWSIYDPGLPVVAVPVERPADPDSVRQTLESATVGKAAVHALFWATDESDPDGLVERWLAEHLYRGAESWQGNLRVVTYHQPPATVCNPVAAGPAALQLTDACVPAATSGDGAATAVAVGRPLPVELIWRAAETVSADLAASLQLLDARRQVVAQHDAPPAALPTSQLAAGDVWSDRRALIVPYGTPPGDYRLVVALYDPATGERLPMGGTTDAPTDLADLATVSITRPERPLTLDLLPVEIRTNQMLGSVQLVGYTQYKDGYAHAPETPVAPGDRVHVTLFWQAPDPLPREWPDDATFTLSLADQSVTLPLAGGAWPTSNWQAGDIVRVEVELPVTEDGLRQRPLLSSGGDELRLQRLPR